MAKAKKKWYVVWTGAKPGIYTSWDDCKAQVHGFEGARYKSFESEQEAVAAFQQAPGKGFQGKGATGPKPSAPSKSSGNIIWQSWSVDAACSGNPGDMEYRGVDTRTRQEIFCIGPMREGTNNIGEFLAIVHALALLEKMGNDTLPIYSDSMTAQSWVRQRKCKTTLAETSRNKPIFELIRRAEAWLGSHHFKNPIYKWDTVHWGEIPADFGRK